MAKLNPVHCCLLYSLACATFVFGQSPEPVEVWLERMKKPSVPRREIIKFYVHDILAGPNQTVWPVAEANITSTSPTNFGRLFISDNLLTAEPNINSQPVGRSQGVAGLAAQNEVAAYLSINFVFTSGKYNGSTISMLGRSPNAEARRELSIVGGTEVFQLARGIAVSTNVPNVNDTNRVVLGFTLYVIHS